MVWIGPLTVANRGGGLREQRWGRGSEPPSNTIRNFKKRPKRRRPDVREAVGSANRDDLEKRQINEKQMYQCWI